jgi:hypothetical protein
MPQTKRVSGFFEGAVNSGFQDINNPLSSTPVLLADNQGAISLSKNAQFQNRTRHVDVKFHWIREHVDKEHFIIKYIPTADMLADMFTKSLRPYKHKDFCRKINLVDLENRGGN